MSKSDKSRLYFSSQVTSLAEGENVSEVEVLRIGTIQDRDLEITAEMLADFVKNHEADVYGCPLQVNLSHFREGEAAGWIKKLYVQGDSLYMTVEWTELGVEKITKKLFQFVSAEFASTYPHAKSGENVRNVFIGAALTNTPALKFQEPIELSEQERQKLTHTNAMIKKYIEDLKARTKLSSEDVKLMRTMLSEAGAEEQKQLEDEAKALEAKAEADAKAEEKAAEELTELRKKAAETVTLEEHNALKVKVLKNELKEQVEGNLMLSETVKTGFRKDDVGDVVSFMAKLSEDQRKDFSALMGKVQHVVLGEIGGKGGNAKAEITDETNLSEEQQESVAKRAKELLSEKKAGNFREATAMAIAELSTKK